MYLFTRQNNYKLNKMFEKVTIIEKCYTDQ